jgi:hypothetical protein
LEVFAGDGSSSDGVFGFRFADMETETASERAFFGYGRKPVLRQVAPSPAPKCETEISFEQFLQRIQPAVVRARPFESQPTSNQATTTVVPRNPRRRQNHPVTVESREGRSKNGRGTVDNMRCAWEFHEVIKPENPGSVCANLVGIATWRDTECIYKCPRLPSWCSTWEYKILVRLNELMPGVPNFPKPVDLVNLSLYCQPNEYVVAEFPSGLRRERSRDCKVLVQEYVKGASLVNKISTTSSDAEFLACAYQGLAFLDAAQTVAKFNHKDLHMKNLVLEPTDPNVVFLFDVVPTRPALIPSMGFTLKIVDCEFGYVKGLEGQPVDCSFELLARGFDPTSFDPGCDAIRFLLCMLNGYGHMDEGRTKFVRMAQELQKKASTPYGKVDSVGVFPEFALAIQRDFCEAPELLCGGFEIHEADFLKNNFFKLLNLLCHKMTIPLDNRVSSPSIQPLLAMLKHLFQVRTQYVETKLRILYEVVLGKDATSIVYMLLQQGIEVTADWVVQLCFMVDECIPHVETVLFKTTRDNRVRKELQKMSDFSAENMMQWMMDHYELVTPLSNTTVIRWVQQHQMRDISLANVPEKVLSDIQRSGNMAVVANRMRELVRGMAP